MQEILEQRHWVFDGQYVGIAEGSDLLPMQQHDIPLVAADLSLTIVELKALARRLFTGLERIISSYRMLSTTQ